MKHLFTFITVLMFCLTGCGGGENSTSDTAATASSEATPGETVRSFANAMQAGDAGQLKALCPDFEKHLSADEINTLARRYASRAQANGGIASITIDNEAIDGDSASVTATLTNGNGLSDTETFALYLEDGRWLIDMSQAFSQLESDGPGEVQPDE